MAYQCNCITDNRLLSAVRAPGQPRAVINRFVMRYKLSTGGLAGKPEQWSPTRPQSMTASLSIIKEESQGPYLTAFLLWLLSYGHSVSKLIGNSICFDICSHETTIESPFGETQLSYHKRGSDELLWHYWNTLHNSSTLLKFYKTFMV